MPGAVPIGTDGNMGSYGSFSSSAYAPGQMNVGGSTHLMVAGLVGISLLVLLGMHIAGFRFAFDVSVGRR